MEYYHTIRQIMNDPHGTDLSYCDLVYCTVLYGRGANGIMIYVVTGTLYHHIYAAHFDGLWVLFIITLHILALHNDSWVYLLANPSVTFLTNLFPPSLHT